jgi:threonine dehydrogenase-like Zn-dependent dehydrogenase
VIEPAPRPGDALIRTKQIGICGSEHDVTGPLAIIQARA